MSHSLIGSIFNVILNRHDPIHIRIVIFEPHSNSGHKYEVCDTGKITSFFVHLSFLRVKEKSKRFVFSSFSLLYQNEDHHHHHDHIDLFSASAFLSKLNGKTTAGHAKVTYASVVSPIDDRETK